MRKNFVLAVSFAFAIFAACDRSPLVAGKPDAQPATSATTVTSTQTPSITVTATVTHPGTETASQTATGTSSESATATATATSTETATTVETQTNTTSSTSTTVAVSKIPVIANVVVEKVDLQGRPAENTRRFTISFNGKAIDIRLKIYETGTGAVLTDSPVMWDGDIGIEVVTTPFEKLRSNTDYSFLVSAVSADGTLVNSLWPGEFTTVYCFIGEWKYYYTDAAHDTDNVGRCHGAMMQCTEDGRGGGKLSGAGEVTPYPYGDIVGNSIDDDCNGIIDDGEAYFCSVNNSNISQGCCVPSGSSFARLLLSNLTHQPNAYTLVKGSNPVVYLYASDGKRYVFANQDVITSWFTSFDGGQLGDLVNVCNTVNELADVELANIPMGGNVTIRPGSYIVKIASDPKLYVVSKGKVLRWLSNPDLAEKLYPGTSTQRIRVILDAFFVNYFIGLPVDSISDYDPAAEWAAADMATEAAAK